MSLTTTAIVRHQSQKKPKLLKEKKVTRSEYLSNVDSCIRQVSSSVELFEKTNEMGKQLGYTPLQIGRDFKQRAKALGKSDRTIQRFLPAEFKGKPRGITSTSQSHEEFSAKMAQNGTVDLVPPKLAPGHFVRCEIAGCDNLANESSSGAYYCEEHLEPMREKHAMARKASTEFLGKFLQSGMEASLQQQESQSIPAVEIPEAEVNNVTTAVSQSEQIEIEQPGSQDEEKQQQWRQQQINVSSFKPELISTYDRQYLESVLTYYYREHLKLVSNTEVTDLERQRNNAKIEVFKLTQEVIGLREKNKELASKLSIYQRSGKGLRYVENKHRLQKHKEKEKKSYASLEECQEYIRNHGIKTKREYWDAAKKKGFPENLPKTRPEHVYRISWNELLGKGK